MNNNILKLLFLSFQLWLLFIAIILFQFFETSYVQIELFQLTILTILYIINFLLCNKFIRSNTSSAFFWFSIAFMVYHLVPLLFYNLIDLNIYSVDISLLFRPSLLSVIGFQSAFIGYYFYGSKTKKRINQTIWSTNQMITSTIILTAIALSFQKVYPILSFDRIETIFVMLISILLLSKRTRTSISNQRRLYLFITIIIFLLGLLYIVNATTGRRDIIKFIIGFSIIWSIYYRKFKVKEIVVGGVAIFMIVLIIALYRTSYYYFDNGSWSFAFMRLGVIFNNYNSIIAVVAEASDFMPNHNNYEYITNNIPSKEPYLYGASLMKIIYAFVPRSIWLDKPIGVQELIILYNKNLFTGGTSQGTTFIGEIYWNLGVFGVIPIMYLLGKILKKIDININSHRYDHWTMIISIIFMSWLIELFRGGVSTIIIINTFQIIVPLLFIWIFNKLIFQHKTITELGET